MIIKVTNDPPHQPRFLAVWCRYMFDMGSGPF